MKSFRPLAALILVVVAAAAVAGDRIPVNSLDDLPRPSYALDGPASALLDDDAAFAALAAKVRADVVDILARYEITDAATLQRLHGTLMSLDMLGGDYAAVEAGIELMRGLEDKESVRLTTGLTTRAMIAALRAAGDDEAALREAYARELEAGARALPWTTVRERILAQKARAEMMSAGLVRGLVQGQIDPAVAAAGALGFDAAQQLINMNYALRMVLPLGDVTASVLQRVADGSAEAKPEIWADRDAVLAAGEGAPVLAAVWDSGVDAAVFGELMFVNPAETVNGRDDDGNGFVDDRHGIAFDLDGRPVPELLAPLGDAAGRIDDAVSYLDGYSDLECGEDSEAARALRSHLAGLEPEQVQGFMDDLQLAAVYVHGTHVAGILAAGNPQVRILAARQSFDHRSVPVPITADLAGRYAEAFRASAAYFRAAGVRVVNMSWGYSLQEVEQSLELNGIGADAAARGAMAREIVGILETGLRDAIGGSPEILFCCAAGNSDTDVTFDIILPSNLELPNLLVVGAVDRAGDPTSFTSGGENVRVHACGAMVESVTPGGRRVRASGTSQAAPAVANLAAKILALRPELDPAAVAALIVEGADRGPGGGDLDLINPRRSLELARAR